VDGPRQRVMSAAASGVGIALLGGAIIRDLDSGVRHNTALLYTNEGQCIARRSHRGPLHRHRTVGGGSGRDHGPPGSGHIGQGGGSGRQKGVPGEPEGLPGALRPGMGGGQIAALTTRVWVNCRWPSFPLWKPYPLSRAPTHGVPCAPPQARLIPIIPAVRRRATAAARV